MWIPMLIWRRPPIDEVRQGHSAGQRPSVRKVSEHFIESAWKEWPEIWFADVSLPPPKWPDFGHGLLILLFWGQFWLCEMCQIWGFWAFCGEHMEGMFWNSVCWCILTTSTSFLSQVLSSLSLVLGQSVGSVPSLMSCIVTTALFSIMKDLTCLDHFNIEEWR